MEQMGSNIKQNADNALQTEKMAVMSARDAGNDGNRLRVIVGYLRIVAPGACPRMGSWPLFVIPAKAGIQPHGELAMALVWIPARNMPE